MDTMVTCLREDHDKELLEGQEKTKRVDNTGIVFYIISIKGQGLGGVP